jgi:hypothetical protein
MSGATLSVSSSVIASDATISATGKIQLAGDFGSTSTAVVPVIGSNKITYPKIQQVGATSLLGNSAGGLANVEEIALGSLVFSSNVLNSPISFYSGINPNATNPVDRPASNGTLYMGTDNQLWIWNGLVYIPLTPKKLVAFAKTLNDQSMAVNDLVQFSFLSINRTSTQGLSVTDSTSGSIFTVTLDANKPSILLKLTVSIGGLWTTNVIAKFFTNNLTASSFTGGPGLILNLNNATDTTSTHVYSEIVSVPSGSSTDYAIVLRNITGGATINIGNGSGIALPYRWILFEEL